MNFNYNRDDFSKKTQGNRFVVEERNKKFVIRDSENYDNLAVQTDFAFKYRADEVCSLLNKEWEERKLSQF